MFTCDTELLSKNVMIKLRQIEEAPIAVTFLICIRDIFGLYLYRDIGYSEVLHGFPQFLHDNSRIVSSLGHNCFIKNPFHFISHDTI
jgi:hypothetical protein